LQFRSAHGRLHGRALAALISAIRAADEFRSAIRDEGFVGALPDGRVVYIRYDGSMLEFSDI